MTESRSDHLDNALILSRRMLEAGSTGDWQTVIALEVDRSGQLDAAFAGAQAADPAFAERIRAILDVDKRLMGLSVTARDQAAAELTQLQRGNKVKQAYQNAGA